MTEDAGLPVTEQSPTTPRLRMLAAAVAISVTLLIAVLIALVQRSNRQRDAALERTRHSYDVVLLAAEAEGSLARAEAALGRFVVDGDRRTGSSYYDAWRHAGSTLDRLTPLVAADPAQAARMRRLRDLYQTRGKELALPATRASYKQGWPALSLFARAGRSNTLPRISRLLREVAEEEHARLGVRSTAVDTRTESANRLARLLSAVGALLALLVAALGWLAVRALAERRVARETAELESDRSAVLERAVEARTAELRDANRQLVESAAVREEAEAKLRQVQKMDAVGQLTGGIAHDFNNMLAVVLGGLELARRRVGEQADEVTRHIDSAMEGANRAAALTRRLLSFARAEPLLPSAADPARLLTDLSSLIDRTIGERITVRIEAEPRVWPVWVDPYQLENAILNLCVNARDAMNGEGVLVMKASNVRLRADEVGALPAGDYVRIAVVDDGAGMSAETLERVFEPFFTTKPTGQGTGLGLSQILSFARQSGGDIGIASRVGAGTTVSVFLPRHHGEAVCEVRSRRPELRLATQSELILVVEDDARVRQATSGALAELGYRTILCTAGEEALGVLKQRRDIALVITDVVMPGMTGPELVERIEAEHPGTAILYVTGYVGDAGEAENFTGHAVLRKPFTIRAIADAVAAALTQQQAPAASAA